MSVWREFIMFKVSIIFFPIAYQLLMKITIIFMIVRNILEIISNNKATQSFCYILA